MSFFNWHSIGFKLTIYIIFCIVFVMGLMGYFFYDVLQKRTEVSIHNALSITVNDIDTELKKAEVALQSLGASVQTLHKQNIKQKVAYKDLIFFNLKNRPSILMALGFGQTPFSLLPDTEWFWPYFYVDQNKPDAIGVRLPPPNNHIRYADLYTEDNYPEQSYYTEPMQLQTKLWSETYNWYGIIMSSFLSPIYDEMNQIIAIGGADVSVTALATKLNKPILNEGGEFILLSQTGKLLVYPRNPEFTYEEKDYTHVENLTYIWDKVQDNFQEIIEYKGYYWTYQKIPTTDWVMLASIPSSIIIEPILSIVLTTMVWAGIILSILLILFIYRLNKRLQVLVQQCHDISHAEQQRINKWNQADGSLSYETNIHVSPKQDSDELALFAHVFNDMTKRLNMSYKLLESHANDLENKVLQRTEKLSLLNETLKEQAESIKEARDLANQASHEKSRFIANMSHELRTPLNAIIGYTELLIEEAQDDAAAQDTENLSDLYKIHSSGTHLLSLINDVLNISKIESGKMELYIEPISIQELINDVKTHVHLQIQKNNNTFTIDNQCSIEYIQLDKLKLKQILLNIIGNSAKFTHEGKVSLTITEHQETIDFIIQDMGIGIDAEQQKKLFIPFNQADASTVRKYGGTGLGLAISKRFAEMMQGSIDLYSEAGKGSRFHISLPQKLD